MPPLPRALGGTCAVSPAVTATLRIARCAARHARSIACGACCICAPFVYGVTMLEYARAQTSCIRVSIFRELWVNVFRILKYRDTLNRHEHARYTACRSRSLHILTNDSSAEPSMRPERRRSASIQLEYPPGRASASKLSPDEPSRSRRGPTDGRRLARQLDGRFPVLQIPGSGFQLPVLRPWRTPSM